MEGRTSWVEDHGVYRDRLVVKSSDGRTFIVQDIRHFMEQGPVDWLTRYSRSETCVWELEERIELTDLDYASLRERLSAAIVHCCEQRLVGHVLPGD
jgi:hypothetical protein